jgi:hypothetical protein
MLAQDFVVRVIRKDNLSGFLRTMLHCALAEA